jgi:hypothetical protein
MLGGIAKIFIAKRSDIYTSGFSHNGSRFGFSLKNGIDWLEVDIMRDTAIDSGKVDNGNDYEVSLNVFNLNLSLNGFIGKRVVVKYITPEGEIRIVGVDQSAFFNQTFDSGVKPGDSVGMIYKITGLSKSISEILKPYTPPVIPIPTPSVKLHFRADDTYFEGSTFYINDKSGNGYKGFGNALVVDNALNSHPIVDLSGSKSIQINGTHIGKTGLWGGNPNALGFKDEFTILAVGKFLESSANTNDFFNRVGYGFSFYHNPSSNKLRASLDDDQGNTYVEFDYDNSWHIWAFRCRVNNKLNVNIDGNTTLECEIGTLREDFSSGYFSMSAFSSDANSHFAELKIWDEVLSDENLTQEINQLKTYYNL